MREANKAAQLLTRQQHRSTKRELLTLRLTLLDSTDFEKIPGIKITSSHSTKSITNK